MLKNRMAMNIHCNHCPVRSRCIAHTLEAEDKEKINAIMAQMHLIQTGEHLYFQQQRMQYIFALYSGSYKEYRIDEDGNEKINCFYFPGDLLALESLSSQKYEFSIMALEPSQSCAIPIDPFFRLMNGSSALLQRFVHLMSDKLQKNKNIPVITNAKCRIAGFLLNILYAQQERKSENYYIDLLMSQSDIGNLLGLAHETVSRTFHLFQYKEIITICHKRIYIADISSLKIIANFYE